MNQAAPVAPVMYGDNFEHLRDELTLVWLRVAKRMFVGWQTGMLPRNPSDGHGGVWGAQTLLSLVNEALCRRLASSVGPELVALVSARVVGEAVEDAALAAAAERAILDKRATLEARWKATVAAGRSLPLVDLSRRFALTGYQYATLILALMPEFDPDLLLAYRYLANDLACRGLDARLLSVLVYETLESRVNLQRDLSPLSPLVLYRLLEPDDSLGGSREPSLYRRIQAAPRLVEIAARGANELDAQMRDAATLVPSGGAAGLFPDEINRRVRDALKSPGVLLVLQGARGTGKRLILENAASDIGKKVMHLNASLLGSLPRDLLGPFVRALVREAMLLDALVVVPNLDEAMARAERRDELPGFVSWLCHEYPGTFAVTFSGEHLPRIDVRPVVQLGLENPTLTHRAMLWRRLVPAIDGTEAAALAERFAIPGGVVQLAAQAAHADPGGASVEMLDRAVRSQLHDRLSRLGRRLDTPFAMEDLVVEQNIRDTLRDIATAIGQRRRVRETWGFRGAQGVSVLFSGSPGVGKTMSATVLARELGLAVYEIDLSSVVSKWIGETEKNLEEIFTAGEPGHAILLFNEADSLFGKRTTDVRNSTDRYANLETNYLLQRLEKFSGLAILTTNLVNAIDAAFRRRFAYDVQFSFPTVEMREELWRRAVPERAQAHIGEIDYRRLAERFELSGGFIKLALERSAFVAAGTGEPLTTEIILPTIERMYLERGKLAAIGRLE